MRIGKRSVEGLLDHGRDYTVWDDELSGFGVRVRPGGAKSYIAVFRPGGGRAATLRKLTLAPVGTVTPEEARTLARKAIAAAREGHDASRERMDARRAATLAELIDRFLSEHVERRVKPATASSYRHVLKMHVEPTLGATRAAKVTPAEVAKLHRSLAGKPAMGNRALAVLSSLYGWASRPENGHVPRGMNPVHGLDRNAERRRDRYLTDAELARLASALDEGETMGLPWAPSDKPRSKHTPKTHRTPLGEHAAAAIRLLLFTGARLREILHLRWEHADLERGLLRLPDSKTGAKTIVLNVPALAILNGLTRAGEYVIAGNDPTKPRADLHKPWDAVRRYANLKDVRLHDLRHTFASVGAGEGLGLPIVGKLLGHSQPATTDRYAHVDASPARRAANAIGERIAAAMAGRADGRNLAIAEDQFNARGK